MNRTARLIRIVAVSVITGFVGLDDPTKTAGFFSPKDAAIAARGIIPMAEFGETALTSEAIAVMDDSPNKNVQALTIGDLFSNYIILTPLHELAAGLDGTVGQRRVWGEFEVGTFFLRQFHKNPQFDFLRRKLSYIPQHDLTDRIGTSYQLSDSVWRNGDISAQLTLGSFRSKLNLRSSSVGIFGSYGQRLIGIPCGFLRNEYGPAGIIERNQQANYANDRDPEGPPRPICSISSANCGLPLGAKIGSAIVLAGLAWPLIFTGLGLFDRFLLRVRNRRKGLLYIFGGLSLFGLSAIIWGWGGT
jgi:hypothetical protein